MLYLIDMDGVLANFVEGMCQLHSKPNPYYVGSPYCGMWQMDKIWNMPASEFWKPADYMFWRSLEPLSDARKIVDLVLEFADVEDVGVLTSPSKNDGCCDAKRDWIKAHFPELERNLILGSAKKFCAGPNTVLIDDLDYNIESFTKFGGNAILLPRLWNSRHALAQDSLSILRGSLAAVSVFGTLNVEPNDLEMKPL